MRYYVLDVNPEPWAIGSVGYARRNGKMQAFVGPNPQLQAYQEAIRDTIRLQDPIMVKGSIRLRFYFQRRLDSYSSEKGRKVVKHRPDVTNMQKATEDALQGILYENDRDVTSIKSELLMIGPEVHGFVIVGIEGDTGISLIGELDTVVFEKIRELNSNTAPPESDLKWGDDDAIF